MRTLSRMFSFALLLLLAAPAGSQPKASPGPLPPPIAEAGLSAEPQFPRSRRDQEEDRFRQQQERAMARERNKARQAALKKDTDRLLELATQLKDYVDRTDENMLSLDVIKKAEEIEKLSKSVKDKMKADAYYPPAGSEPQR